MGCPDFGTGDSGSRVDISRVELFPDDVELVEVGVARSPVDTDGGTTEGSGVATELGRVGENKFVDKVPGWCVRRRVVPELDPTPVVSVIKVGDNVNTNGVVSSLSAKKGTVAGGRDAISENPSPVPSTAAVRRFPEVQFAIVIRPDETKSGRSL